MLQWATVLADVTRSRDAAPPALKPEPAHSNSKEHSPWNGNQSRLRSLANPQAANSVLQRKLTIGATNDPLETEADRTADRILRMPDQAISSSPAIPEPVDKQSDSLNHDTEPELAGGQPAQGAGAGLPEFLRHIYGPANIEDGMSEPEMRARGVALFSAEQIEISLGDALRSLHDTRVASSRSAAGSAADAKRSIRLNVQKEKDKFEQVWETQDIAVKSAILAEYDSLREDYATRQREVTQRVENSTTGLNTLFSEHQSNLDRVAQEGGADCEKARRHNWFKIMNDFYDTEEEVSSLARAIRQSFGATERDDAMRDGISWVEKRVIHEMDDRLEDAQAAIDDFFLKQPSPDPRYASLPESMRPKVSMQSIIVGSSKKAQEGFDSHKQEILDQIQETGPMALDSLDSIYAGESSYLDQLQQSAPDQLAALKSAAFDRMDRLGQNASDQIDHALPIALGALIHVEASVRRRLEPLGKKAIDLLRADVPPEEQESRDVAFDLSQYFQSSADFAAGGMADGASHASLSFLHLARQTQTALTSESPQAAKYVIQLSLEVSHQLEKLQQQRMRQMQSSCDDLNQVLDDCDQKFIDQFSSMVQDFRIQIKNTINSMNGKIAQAMEDAKSANNKAAGTVQDAMYEEASDRAFKYDHRILHALDVGLQSGWAAIKATVHLIASVIEVIIIAFVAVLALVLLGVELAIAEAIVAIAMLGYMAYQAIKAYHARRDKGQSEFNAIFGSVGDVTGISQIYHGITDEYLTLPERTEMITSGIENVVLLTYGQRINEGIGNLAREDAPWLDEPPTPPSPSAASAIEPPSAPGGTLSDGATGGAQAVWQPPSLKQALAEWNAAQTPGRAAGDAVHPPAPAISPAPSLAPSETPADSAAGAAAPTANHATPVQLPVADSPRHANDSAITPPQPHSSTPVAADTAGQGVPESQPQSTPATAAEPARPSTAEDISPDDPRLKEQDVQDIRPRIARLEAAKQTQQAIQEAVAQNENVEIEQANEDTGQQIQATAAGGGGGGRRVRPGGGIYRKNSGTSGGRSTTSNSGSTSSSTSESGSGPSSGPSKPAQTGPAAPAPIEQSAQPVFQPGYRSTPKAITQRLRLAGLSEGEIVGFGAEDASQLSATAAERAARLGEHFSAGDMKSLGSFLERTGRVMDNKFADRLIEKVDPGGLSDTLRHIEFAEAYSSDTGVAVEVDPDSGINLHEAGVKIAKAPKAPPDVAVESDPGKAAEIDETKAAPKAKEFPPAWRQAEIDLKPALDRKFGGDWKADTRFRPELADKGELLGSTRPEYFREATPDSPPMAFEVKRFNLEEMGIGRDGKVISSPSKATTKALLRARLQLASRKANLPKGTVQNIVFNVSWQGVTDVSAVGETITGLLKSNSIDYDHVYVQEGGSLIEISNPSHPESPLVPDTTPEKAPAADSPKTPTFERPPIPADPGANIKMLSKAEIKELQKKGFDVHEEKGEGNVSQSDLYKDPYGNVWVKMKGGHGEAEYTGWKLKE